MTKTKADKALCVHCRKYSEKIKNPQGALICSLCKQRVKLSPKFCLRCDRKFYSVNKFNRLCSFCSKEISGVDLYGSV